jgi:hypothetical protein
MTPNREWMMQQLQLSYKVLLLLLLLLLLLCVPSKNDRLESIRRHHFLGGRQLGPFVE